MEKISRRKFIRDTGVSTAGLVAAAPFVASGLAKASPNDTVNIAVVGIRSRGAQHAVQLNRLKNVQVTHVVDADENLFPAVLADIEKNGGKKPKTVVDLRQVLDDKDVDAISIATTNDWHSLQSIWACQAGKDVYLEKPISHTIWEGRKAVEAARKYNRIVQTGTQRRSMLLIQKAMEFLHSGGLGDLYMVRCGIFRPRHNIGRGRVKAVPPGVHYDLWVGPAPFKPFNPVRFHYQWHWFWDKGNGETGNNGPHSMDIARWALGKYEHPVEIQSMGPPNWYDSDQTTPNTQMSVMKYSDGQVVHLEIRNHWTDGGGAGTTIYGTKGWLEFRGMSWQTFFGPDPENPEEGKAEPGPSMTNEDAKALIKELDVRGTGGGGHFQNFIDAVRTRDRSKLNADVLEGHLSTSMCHLCNIAYRVGRTVHFDSVNEEFPGDDEANALVTKDYRYPYVVPENV
jgi:predicted dehydrogenase